MGRGCTHHHVTKSKIEDQSRRPTIATDYYVMKLKSVVNAQTKSEESVTCIAVKEDRHQNMSSDALTNGDEEPWTMERVAKVIDSLGYREITLKSDTEPATIAFRNREADMCKAEVTTEGAVKVDKESNGLIENALMLIGGIIRTIKCHTESSTQEPLSDESLFCHGGWNMQDKFCPDVKKFVTGKRHSKDCMAKKPTQNMSHFCENMLAKQISKDPMN